MKTRLIASLSFVALLGLSAVTALAEIVSQSPSHLAGDGVRLTRSREHRIESKAVGDEYVVRVRLPGSYEKGDARYPVVYVLDADVWFGVASDIADNLPSAKETPEVIVVGIAYGKTIDDWWQKRARDFLTPSTRDPVPKDIPLAGGAMKFQEFFAGELIPFIESNYRTQPNDRSLVGFSYGGVFAVHTLFTRPELFQRYIIISPSLGWDKDQLFDTEAQYFGRSQKLRATVFLSTGDKEGGAKALDRWNRIRELIESRHYEGLRFVSQIFPDETHLSNFAVSYTHGLKAVFFSGRAIVSVLRSDNRPAAGTNVHRQAHGARVDGGLSRPYRKNRSCWSDAARGDRDES